MKRKQSAVKNIIEQLSNLTFTSTNMGKSNGNYRSNKGGSVGWAPTQATKGQRFVSLGFQEIFFIKDYLECRAQGSYCGVTRSHPANVSHEIVWHWIQHV
jgi:hypothetical protein